MPDATRAGARNQAGSLGAALPHLPGEYRIVAEADAMAEPWARSRGSSGSARCFAGSSSTRAAVGGAPSVPSLAAWGIGESPQTTVR